MGLFTKAVTTILGRALNSLGVQIGSSPYAIDKISECGKPSHITGDTNEHVATESGVLYGIWISATLIGTVSIAVDVAIGSAQCIIPIGTGIGFYKLPLYFNSALRVKLSAAGDDISVIFDGSVMS